MAKVVFEVGDLRVVDPEENLIRIQNLLVPKYVVEKRRGFDATGMARWHSLDDGLSDDELKLLVHAALRGFK